MTIENDIVKRYFDAWHQHDSDAILATFAEGGSYSDPATEGEIKGAAIAEYAQSLFAAFPDMSIELICNVKASTGTIAAPWIIFGTNEGSLMGNDPTGKTIVFQGCDFMQTKDGLLTRVVGLWDVNDLLAQLDLPA